MSKIEIMSENLANKIAAGEVVERCMNVVKELVENSIDAKADEIKINLVDSGVKEITVIDNGCGMDKKDAETAFYRHATSKLKTLEDLFYINSLGFRGEALPSIAAISTVVLKTCDGNEGTEVVVDGGIIKSIGQSDLLKGTRITVKNLFYNTPVRLKYLKNLYTELANITEYVNKMALSFPNIRFVLQNNDKIILNTDGKGNILKVIANIYDYDVAKKMIEINEENDDYKIYGYIGYPEIARNSKNNIITLVNDRVIKNYELNKTVKECYHTYIPESKNPIVVLKIETDPILIDVNVHPTKMDIKFSKMESLKELITKSITEKLETYNLIPEIKEVYDSIKENEEIDVKNIQSEEDEKLEEYKLDLEEDKEFYQVKDEDKEVEYTEKEIQNTHVLEDDKIITPRIKKMYPIGVIHATYIIAENEYGMYIIDQHACAERINFEKYLKYLKNHDNTCCDLLVPIKLELSNKDNIILKENMKVLTDMGFALEEFGVNTDVVRTHPVWLPFKDLTDSIKKIIDIIIENETFNYDTFIWRVCATLACKHSIRAHDIISKSDMEELLEKIRYCENPFTCPHGRPTIISYSEYELEKMFKRVMN